MWFQENWSAFAPDFKEIDENIEYEERESEFDLEDEDKEELLNTNQDQTEESEVSFLFNLGHQQIANGVAGGSMFLK